LTITHESIDLIFNFHRTGFVFGFILEVKVSSDSTILLSSLTEDEKLTKIDNIEIDFRVELGSSKVTVRDLLKLNVGSVIELDRLAGEHLDIRLNGKLTLKGEIVSIADILGVRVTDIVTAEQRAKDAK
jgi:flagellar motor switch protein FliN/FliY